MKRCTHSLPLTVAFFSSFLSHLANADMDKTIEDALKFGEGGAVKLDFNYRWENSDQELGAKTPSGNYPKTANAQTIRTRVGVLSPKFFDIQGYVEYEGTHALQADYNDGRNNNPEFTNTPTPAQNELSQLWVSYSGLPDTVIKGGRQTMSFDDDRFIAPVLWQQLNVNFDSVLVTNKSVENLTVNAGYIGNVQTFLSTTENIDAPILNVNYKVGDYGNMVGYGYWLDYTEAENYFKSNQTYGLRFNGKSPKLYENYNLLYTAEWSVQEDYGHAPKDYEAHRFNAMGGFTAYFLTLQGAVEQLNGAGANKKFITPLGANHIFQGWADVVLPNTANDGIRDVFTTATVKVLDDSLTVSAIYHDLSDDTGNMHYGDEWDFQAVKKFGKHYSVLAKYANYSADLSDGYTAANNTDTQKIWLQGNVNF